jgi:small subunit ribosomal protein S20
MATHKSAKKRTRQNETLRLRNRSNMSTMKTVVKKVTQGIQNKDLENLDTLFRQAQSVIAKTCKKGAIHKNNMARRISRLHAMIQKAKAPVA